MNPESAVLVSVSPAGQKDDITAASLDELSFLLETAGGNECGRFVQKLAKPDSRTYVGSGKLEEIKSFVENNHADIAIFDDELSPAQMRNIEHALGCRILDRNNLILDIFARHARTSYARTQVELAQYQYLLPRLTGMWTHLEKQRGGIGLKGPGEKEIETDRRVIRDKIALLKEKLKQIDKQKITQRGNRKGLVRVALVGYTNTGKSTLMNLLGKSDVLVENKLFATLDTTVRKVVVENMPFLLADTVGFIRKLPHSLIESFKSTLDEVLEADMLVHVVDISHPDFEEQMAIVRQTLSEIKASGKPVITVFNKLDLYKNEEMPAEALQKTWISRNNGPALFISATRKTNITELRALLYREIRNLHVKIYPYDHFLYPSA